METEIALQEYRQLSTRIPPGTLVSYRVTLAPVVEFRQGYRAGEWPPLWEEFLGDWREVWFNPRVEPPSGVLAEEVIASGGKAGLFPSHLAPGGTHLVVYPDQLEATDRIGVYDPAGALPRNQDSWG